MNLNGKDSSHARRVQAKKEKEAEQAKVAKEVTSKGLRNRRLKPDWVVNAATVLSIISWIGAFAVWLIIDQASPVRTQFFETFTGTTHFAQQWNTSLLPTALVLLIVSFVTCVIAFFFNMMRMRRKTDKYRKSIIIIGVITLIGIAAFIMRFGPYL